MSALYPKFRCRYSSFRMIRNSLAWSKIFEKKTMIIITPIFIVNNGKKVKSWQSVALTIKYHIWWASVLTQLAVSFRELHKLSVSALQLVGKIQNDHLLLFDFTENEW